MSDKERNHELDDELLSAYVDGELTESERAAVEARLASDPDAQHTLQQLRSVSQAVQALPQEPIGRDLREQILRRVQKVKPASRVATAARSVAADGAPSLSGDTMPKITILQTRRSWVWASLAVAAGLLIMFLQQSGDERGKNLPAVANRDKDTHADTSREVAARRSRNEPAPASAAVDPMQAAKTDSPPPASIATAPTTPLPAGPRAEPESAPRGKFAADGRATTNSSLPATAPMAPERNVQLSDVPSDEEIRAGVLSAAGRPSPPPANHADEPSSSASSRPSPAPESRRVALRESGGSKVATGAAGRAAPSKAAAPQSAGRGVAGGGAIGGAVGERLELNGEQKSLLVVHVVATKDALQNKAFDRLLARNGITLELESQREVRAGGATERLEKQAEVGRAAGNHKEEVVGGERDVEFVLVEAPRPAIELCLTGLNKDSKNYPGVEVDEPTVGQDRGDAKATLDKKAPTDLSRFSRGVVPQQQKETIGNLYYNYTDADKDRSKADDNFRGGFRAADELKPQKESEQLLEQNKDLENRGRARRLLSSELGIRSVEKPATLGGETRPQNADEMKLRRTPVDQKTPAGAETANVQVLFVLSPDREAASSAPAEKSAK